MTMIRSPEERVFTDTKRTVVLARTAMTRSSAEAATRCSSADAATMSPRQRRCRHRLPGSGQRHLRVGSGRRFRCRQRRPADTMVSTGRPATRSWRPRPAETGCTSPKPRQHRDGPRRHRGDQRQRPRRHRLRSPSTTSPAPTWRRSISRRRSVARRRTIRPTRSRSRSTDGIDTIAANADAAVDVTGLTARSDHPHRSRQDAW